MAVTRSAPLPAVRSEEARRARLRIMKRRATALLAGAAVAFVAVTVLGGENGGDGWVGYARAMAEAALIGGLADWFAVTALFRHPLGIPIPHTAIVAARKDAFAETLGGFIQDSFLTPDAVVARVRAAGVVGRLADWLADETHARRAADEALRGAVSVADVLRDEDVHRLIESVARARLDALPVAPLAGRALELARRDGRHHQVMDAALRELDGYLDSHRDELRGRLGQESPWWLPGAAEDKIFDRLITGARSLIADLLTDPDHELRRRFDERLAKLAVDLQTSPELADRAEQLKRDVLARAEVGAWVSSVWRDAKAELRAEATDVESDLHGRLAAMVVAAGRRLQDDPELSAKVEQGVEQAARHLVERFQGEIVGLVRDTIGRWDAAETSDRLELLLGPDLQFIRINGTVVGAAAGLFLHAVGQLLS
jgi:uncharacterized membrane-anchored protein YjiN (DUF445 family)